MSTHQLVVSTHWAIIRRLTLFFNFRNDKFSIQLQRRVSKSSQTRFSCSSNVYVAIFICQTSLSIEVFICFTRHTNNFFSKSSFQFFSYIDYRWRVVKIFRKTISTNWLRSRFSTKKSLFLHINYNFFLKKTSISNWYRLTHVKRCNVSYQVIHARRNSNKLILMTILSKLNLSILSNRNKFFVELWIIHDFVVTYAFLYISSKLYWKTLSRRSISRRHKNSRWKYQKWKYLFVDLIASRELQSRKIFTINHLSFTLMKTI